MAESVVIGLSAVVVAVTDDEPRVLIVSRRGHPGALPFGPLDPAGDRTLDLGLRSWVRQQSGLELGYVEQLYTFGDRDRLGPSADGQRLISVAYLALVREGALGGGGEAHWRNIYDFLPWEDGRERRTAALKPLTAALDAWTRQEKEQKARALRRERIDVAFGLRGASWDADRVLERYELLYEARLLSEATRSLAGEPLDLDHRRILATALGRLRGKIRYRPVVFELLPRAFTLLQLQRLVEALAGYRLHKQNFRRLMATAGLVEGTGKFAARTAGRPAELFRFRRDVWRERLAPGVGRPNRA